jgi:hypothetical protein
MGILRDSPSATKYPTLDPFEICDDVMIDLPSRTAVSAVASKPCIESPNSEQARTGKSERTSQNNKKPVAARVSFLKRGRAARYYAILCIFGFGLVTIFATMKPWSYFSQPNLVYAYFEVRALDENGHPIAGAVVKNAGKRVGTTDSFGEWRRYMQVPLGSTVPISLTKKTAHQLLFVSKNFAVPPVKQDKNEIELRSSVQLIPTEPAAVGADINGSVRTSESTNVTIVQTSEAKPKIMRQEAGSSLNLSDLESVWFSASDARNDKELLPALVTRAKELGLKVEKNAPWQIQLTNLIDKPAKISKDGGGLILVSSVLADASQPSVEFLRNYQADARTTARGILFGLVNHVKKNVLLTQTRGRWAAVLPKNSPQIWRLSSNQVIHSSAHGLRLSDEAYVAETTQGFYLKEQKDSPCAPDLTSCYAHTASFLETPPVIGWRRLKLTTSGIGKDSVKVFVSGYSAKALGDNVFEYWGQERAKANATILQNDRLVLRGAVSGSASASAILGSQNLSRR